jgi:Tol biopolymer transport system component
VGIDILKGETFDSPQKTFGGDEDYIWSPDSKSIIYVSKKSRNTICYFDQPDLYRYNLATGITNRTADNLDMT